MLSREVEDALPYRLVIKTDIKSTYFLVLYSTAMLSTSRLTALFAYFYESIVEMVSVVSSSTSRRTLTVSREVMMVTLFSVA